MERYLIIVLSLLLFSCKKEDETTQIRIYNNTGYEIEEVTIIAGNTTRKYTNIENGQYSRYQPVDLAYRYAYGEAVIDGVTYTHQIDDYVGEKELGAGKFTYELTIYDYQNPASLVVLLQK